MKLKSDTFYHVKKNLAYVNNQFSNKVQTIRSDNGTEFFNQEMNTLLASLGIIHESTCVNTPQQNGVAERNHRHLLNVARAIRFSIFLAY